MQKSRSRITLVRLLFVAFLVGALVPTAQAQKWKRVTERTKLKAGDKVQVEFMGEWVDAKIVAVLRNGSIRASFRRSRFDKRVMTHVFTSNQVRVEAKPRGGRSSKRTGNPFEPEKGFRTWQDDTSKFKIEAEFVELEDGAVRLRRRDGRIVTVPLDRLCQEDRRFVRRLQGETDEDEDEDEEEGGFIDELPTRRASWDNAMSVYLSEDVKSSGLAPDGGAAAKTLTRRPVSLPPKDDFFDNAQGLFIAADAPNWVMLPFSRMSQHHRPTRIVLCDLARGTRQAQSVKFPVDALAIDLGPSGKQVLSRPNGFHFGTKARVDVWSVRKGRLEHEFGWKPYEGAGHGNRDEDVAWAAFVDTNRVLTLGSSGKLALWKLPDVRAIYSTKLLRGTRPALSAGRKYLAALTDIGLVVLDAKTGELKGFYRGAPKQGAVAFRPDGKRIALATSKRLVVWEFADGTLYRDIGLGVEALRSNKIAWPSKNYILVGGRYLVDLEKYSVLWDYQGGSIAGSVNRQFWCLCSEGNQLALVPQPLPHNSAKEVARRLQPKDVQAIEPGVTVSLEVHVSASANRREQIREAYRQQLKDRGFKVADGEPLKLVVRTKTGKAEKVLYVESGGFRRLRPFGPLSEGGDFEIVRFRQQISQVAFVIDGQTAWEKLAVVTAPGQIRMKEGESMQQAVRRHEKPNLHFFDGVQIPSHVARPHKDVTFGASKLTPYGLRPAETEPRKKEEKPQPSQPTPSGRHV